MQVLASSDFGTLTFLSAPYFYAFLLFHPPPHSLSYPPTITQASKQMQASKHAIKTNKQADKQANIQASVHASNVIKDVNMENPTCNASKHTSKQISKQACNA